jgi:hypothetical protein
MSPVTLGDPGHGEVLVAIVHRLALAAVDRDHRMLEQPQMPANDHELRTFRPDRRSVVAAKAGDSFEVRRQASGQPRRLDVTLGLAFELSVEVDLEQGRGVIVGPIRHYRPSAFKA